MGNSIFCCGCVDEGRVAVVERWGRFHRLAYPGFHCFNVFAGERSAGLLSTKISSLLSSMTSKTKDNVFVRLSWFLRYRVVKEDAADAFYELKWPKRHIRCYVYHARMKELASAHKGEAEKVILVKKAEAEAEAKYLSGVGMARQRQAITDGLRESILNFPHDKVEGASAKEVMDMIMTTQYFDAIKDLRNSSSKNTTVLVPPHIGN